MVVAELPLWVIHGGSNEETTTSHAEESFRFLKKQSKSAIYSVDWHPDHSRFATAGGDGTVRLWSSRFLFPKTRPSKITKDGIYISSSSGESEDSDEDHTDDNNGESSAPAPQTIHDLTGMVRRKGDMSPSKKDPSSVPPSISHSPSNTTQSARTNKHKHHRLQCTLNSHTGSSVLCVRFSHNGQQLASAGDDGSVCIYKNEHLSNNPNNWMRTRLCRGHGLDCVDLAWSPDDEYLVSCSLDSATPIIVWKINQPTASNSMIGYPYKILGLNVHNSTVKGVAFDPAGSYLASSSDDPAVCIWRAHDDWGLESRIDSGIFRQWGTDGLNFSQQTMFRRICWSTDGAFCVSTNSVVKNKHVASTIARENWAIATTEVDVAGAANLVGHSQAIVVSREAPFLQRRKRKEKEDQDDDEEEDEPEYATLLALGDRKGFISVWSTSNARPLFLLQCSQPHCTVTDLSWGQVGNGDDVMLLVSLLDGQVIAIRFSVPDEIEGILSAEEKARVFQLRYGLGGDSSRFVGGTSSKLIENALQVTLEDKHKKEKDAVREKEPVDALMGSISSRQEETKTQTGKKRIRPVFVPLGGPQKAVKTTSVPSPKETTPIDPVQDALKAAEQAATNRVVEKKSPDETTQAPAPSTPSAGTKSKDREASATTISKESLKIAIPTSKERKLSIELPRLTGDMFDPLGTTSEKDLFRADCVNIAKVPPGSKGSTMPCIEVSIQKNGHVTWRDLIPGASWSAVSASKHALAVGCDDGSIQLFGTSPTLGWSCGSSFRSHAPLVLGSPIVSLVLNEGEDDDERPILEMLVVTADGDFGVYRVFPELCLQYKGSVMPAMKHMSLSSLFHDEMKLPKLSRAQLTDHGSVLLLLSFDMHGSDRRAAGDRTPSRTPSRTSAQNDTGPGGALQSFIYDRKGELWIRLADSRFVLSDFYNTLPTTSSTTTGALSRLEDTVRAGSLQSSLKASHGGGLSDRQAGVIHGKLDEEQGSLVPSRAHCEDRMACTVALDSPSEFKYWLSLYARTLAVRGMASQVRMLVDMLLGKLGTGNGRNVSISCWWLSSAPSILGLDRRDLVRSVIIPELGRNRYVSNC